MSRVVPESCRVFSFVFYNLRSILGLKGLKHAETTVCCPRTTYQLYNTPGLFVLLHLLPKMLGLADRWHRPCGYQVCFWRYGGHTSHTWDSEGSHASCRPTCRDKYVAVACYWCEHRNDWRAVFGLCRILFEQWFEWIQLNPIAGFCIQLDYRWHPPLESKCARLLWHAALKNFRYFLKTIWHK